MQQNTGVNFEKFEVKTWKKVVFWVKNGNYRHLTLKEITKEKYEYLANSYKININIKMHTYIRICITIKIGRIIQKISENMYYIYELYLQILIHL